MWVDAAPYVQDLGSLRTEYQAYGRCVVVREVVIVKFKLQRRITSVPSPSLGYMVQKKMLLAFGEGKDG